MDVVFGAGKNREVVQPDLLLLLNDQRDLITEKEIGGAPALLIGILSVSTAERDRQYKKSLYGRYGVREYWLVDPATQTIEIYTLDAHGLQQSAHYGMRDELQSPLLPSLQITLQTIFG